MIDEGKGGRLCYLYPDSKVRGAKMGLPWDRQDPGGPHVGPMNFAIWVQTDTWLRLNSCVYNMFHVCDESN